MLFFIIKDYDVASPGGGLENNLNTIITNIEIIANKSITKS